MATRRGARYLSAEDLIFLIRHDRGKVNRLRTYLSWKDVRKHAKDSGGDGGGGVEVENLEDGADGEIFYASFSFLYIIIIRHFTRQTINQSSKNHCQITLGDNIYILGSVETSGTPE